MVRAIVVVLCWAATGAVAQQIDRSPLPPPNPLFEPALTLGGTVAAASPEASTTIPRPEAENATYADNGALRPKPRPATLAGAEADPVTVAEGQSEEAVARTSAPTKDALASSQRPLRRPKALAERIAGLKATSNAPGLDLSSNPDGKELELAAVAPPTRKEKRKKKREAASMKGAVCGVAAIKGTEIKRIPSKVKGCGVEDPVAITSVAGVRLSQTATVDCSIAKALNSWVDEVAQPAFDGNLVEMQVAAHYICRSRNNIRGAKISEHGKGRAIDISGFVLSNGKVLTVSDNYNRLLRGIYKAACPYFHTTLGPGSDGYHENHFHFDTSARDGGAYCR